MQLDYNHIEDDRGIPDQVKDWMDERIHGGLKTVGAGALQVLSAGFGKGMMIAAAIVAATILVGAIAAPGLMFGSAFANITVAKAVSYAIPSIGNFLLGSGAGVSLMLAGGVVGSMSAAHSQNSRINADAAEKQARMYEQLRATQSSPEKQQELCPHAQNGHCAQLLQNKNQQQEMGR